MPQVQSVKALREKLAEPAAAIRALRDQLHARNDGKAASEWQDFSAEEQAAWAKANADYQAIEKQIGYAEAVEKIDARLSMHVGDTDVGRDPLAARDVSPQATDAHRALAFGAWLQGDRKGLTSQQAEACELIGFNPRASEISIPLMDSGAYKALQSRFADSHPSAVGRSLHDFKATLSIGSGSLGGYTIQSETLVRQLEINMLAYGGMRQVAESIRTATGERLSMPTADDTTNTGAQLGESTTIGSSVDPSFGKVYWDAYKFSSKPILVPFELIQDSFVNLPSVLGDMLGERLGRITNTRFTTGSGAATCKGLVTCATSFSAASASAIAADDILGLIHSVDPAYRVGGGFMFHDSILLIIRKLKDGNGQYLWQSGMQSGAPDRLLSFPITINQDMDSTVSSGKKSMLFGRLSNYKIRSVGEVRLYRLQERYRDLDQDAFIAFTREDGNLLTAGTAPVKYLAH